MLKTINIVEDTIPAAWEKAVIETWTNGAEFPTDYDKPGDPPSRDASAQILVTNPFKEPRIHRAFPGGLDDLWKYREEVINGIHDHWCEPNSTKWSYTYHRRLAQYPIVRIFAPDGKEKDPEIDTIDPSIDKFEVDRVNQLEDIIADLKRAGFSRRAVAGLWRPYFDIKHPDPPCFNEMQCRISNDKKLVLQILIRSNDAFKAGFMNMFAFTELQKEIAARLGVEPGEYCHHAFSFHIYGSYFSEFQGFLDTLKKRPKFEDRTYTTEYAQDFFNEGRLALLNDCLDYPEKILPRHHQIRIYNELPQEYRDNVDPRVRQMISGR